MIDNNTDLTGMQFNEWTVLYRDFEKENEVILVDLPHDAMLHENGSSLFLVDTIDSQYWFGQNSDFSAEGDLSSNTLTIPATYVCENSRIKVIVNQKGTSNIYDDWVIKEVKRPKDQGLDSFTVSFTSSSMKKVDVDAGDTATVVIYPYGDDVQPVELRFRAKEKKILFYTSYEWELVK